MSTTRQQLEALLFLADAPVELRTLGDTLGVDADEVETELVALAHDLESGGRGLRVREVAAGWRMYTAPETQEVVERYVLAGRSGRLTQAALETLAVIAYKQPISRAEVSEIRGVNADGAVRSLVTRGYIEETGRDDGPGQAILYGTSELFLERLGLTSLDALPTLTDFLPEAPAPDEPGLDRLKEARKHLASGEELPSTGAPRWEPEVDTGTNTGPDEIDEGDDALPPIQDRGSRRDQDDEMDELTARLEQAAKSAMSQLRTAVAASEEDDEDPATDGDHAATEDTPAETTSDG